MFPGPRRQKKHIDRLSPCGSRRRDTPSATPWRGTYCALAETRGGGSFHGLLLPRLRYCSPAAGVKSPGPLLGVSSCNKMCWRWFISEGVKESDCSSSEWAGDGQRNTSRRIKISGDGVRGLPDQSGARFKLNMHPNSSVSNLNLM